jgi:hypothetical protein
LEVKLSGGVEKEHVDGAVQQVIHMNDITELGSQHAVLLIHDIEPLVTVLGGGGCGGEGEGLPLSGAELLGANGGRHAKCGCDFFPVVFELRKQVAELLAAFGKSASHEGFKNRIIDSADPRSRLAAEGDDGRVHFGPWKENGCREFAFESDIPAAPCAECHGAVITRIVCRTESLCQLELERENKC